MFIDFNIIFGFSVKETHQMAEAQLEKNARLRAAFGLSDTFVEGSSLARRGAQDGNQGYTLVRTPSPVPAPQPDSTQAKRKRRKRDR